MTQGQVYDTSKVEMTDTSPLPSLDVLGIPDTLVKDGVQTAIVPYVLLLKKNHSINDRLSMYAYPGTIYGM